MGVKPRLPHGDPLAGDEATPPTRKDEEDPDDKYKGEDRFDASPDSVSKGFTCAMALFAFFATMWGLSELYPEHVPQYFSVEGENGLRSVFTTASEATIRTIERHRKALLQNVLEEKTDPGRNVLTIVVLAAGDATPEQKYSFEEDIEWDDGYGRLTIEGIKMMHSVGRELRQKYILNERLVNKTWDPNYGEVHVRSVGSDRAVTSARAMMMGMFPPKDVNSFTFGAYSGQNMDEDKIPVPEPSLADCSCRPKQIAAQGEWMKNRTEYECIAECLGLAFGDVDAARRVDHKGIQRVAVEEPLDVDQDILLLQSKNCFVYKNMTLTARTSRPWMAKTENEFQSQLETLRRLARCDEKHILQKYSDGCQLCSTGARKACSTVGLEEVAEVYRNLQAAIRHGKRWPPAVNVQRFSEQLETIVTWMWWQRYKPLEEGRERGGFLLGEIVDRLSKAADGSAKQRLTIYVAQESTISDLFTALNVRQPRIPGDSNQVVIELRDMSGERPTPETTGTQGYTYSNPGEAKYWVSVYHDGAHVNIMGCPNGRCSWPQFRTATALAAISPNVSPTELQHICIGRSDNRWARAFDGEWRPVVKGKGRKG